jgi:hypothetical protein
VNEEIIVFCKREKALLEKERKRKLELAQLLKEEEMEKIKK